MKLTEEQLDQIEQFSAALMSVAEIAVIMEVDESEFRLELEDRESPVFKSHQKGYLLTKFSINQKIVESAIGGDSTAIGAANRMLATKKLTDFDE